VQDVDKFFAPIVWFSELANSYMLADRH